MKKNRLLLCALSLCVAGVASADTDFLGGDLTNVVNWSAGLPTNQVATINSNGTHNLQRQNQWLLDSTVTIGGGAVLTLVEDWASDGATLVTINDATITCGDDFAVEYSTVILNAGSAVSAQNLWDVTYDGKIIINGGTHSSGSNPTDYFGAQRKTGVDMLGGQVTAGGFKFNAGTTNTLGGSAVLLSASAETGLIMGGTMDVASTWTGSWAVDSFTLVDYDWAYEVVGGDWTVDGTPIDTVELFAANFAVSPDGTTLSIGTSVVVPPFPDHTVFLGGDLFDVANWSFGLPAGQVAVINTNGFYGDGISQVNGWLSSSTATFGGGATFELNADFAAYNSVLVTINDATINCTDDFFVDRGNIVLNAGSVTIANDDWEANNSAGRITVNGGTHNSGSGTGNNVGAQGNSTKIGCGVDFRGGTVTAGNFRFQINSTSSVGGSAILASAGSSTTFSDMAGLVDFIPGWTGSWEVGSFAAGDWETALTGGGNFTFDGAAIDAASFADNFFVSVDGATLTMAALDPEEIGDISITTLPGGDVEISWNGVAGHTYAVEYKNDLTAPGWTVYTNGVSGTGPITVTVDVTEPETFYQVTGERN